MTTTYPPAGLTYLAPMAAIIPFLGNGFGVFMTRQHPTRTIPEEPIEPVHVHGSLTRGVNWHVVPPALRSAAALLAIFAVSQTWNDLRWPPMASPGPENSTVQISLRSLGIGHYTDYSQVFAGTALATVPLLVVLIVFGRQIIGGIMKGAIKA
jgi:cellobiose transport system permease protein